MPDKIGLRYVWRFMANTVNRTKVGDRFKTGCGTDVELMSFVGNSHRAVVQDSLGRSKVVSTSSLRKGKISWNWDSDNNPIRKDTPSISVGDRFTLNSGIEVEVIGYKNSRNVVVMDVYSNTKTVNAYDLKTGRVKWFINAVHPEYVRVGDVLIMACGTPVVVTRVSFSGVVDIQDSKGEVRTTLYRSLKNGNMYWVDDKYADHPEGYYVYIVKHMGVVVYVGKGKGKRSRHVSNGQSHSEGLNRLYFLGESVELSYYISGITEAEALSIENSLIFQYQPSCNAKKKPLVSGEYDPRSCLQTCFDFVMQ